MKGCSQHPRAVPGCRCCLRIVEQEVERLELESQRDRIMGETMD